ncbi:MAG: hypothetical protein WKF73_07005 [Nocardioidaceae bacterium]
MLLPAHRAVPARTVPLRRLPGNELNPGHRGWHDEALRVPRYLFSSKSGDILGLCAAAPDQLGIAHRQPLIRLDLAEAQPASKAPR